MTAKRPETDPNFADFPDVHHIRTTKPRATRTFTCTICNGKIAAGSVYVRYVYVDYDALPRRIIRTAKCHEVCDV